jgi:hypothetical protein
MIPAHLKRLVACAVLAGACINASSKDSDWPELAAPAGATMSLVAHDIVLNGHRSRIVQVEAQGGAQELVAHYREQFGARRVENRVGDMQVIATQQGQHFHTVQVRRSGLDAAQATVVTTLIGPKPLRSAALNDTQAWLPTETKTLQTLEADDAGARSITVTAFNQQAMHTNRGLLLQAAEQRGFRLTHEDKLPAFSAGVRDGVSLWLSSKSEQAIVSVVDTGEQRAITIVRTRQVP